MVINSISALFPCLNWSWDVKGGTDIFSVHVVSEIISKNWLVFIDLATVQPWSVLWHSHTSLVSLNLATNNAWTHTAFIADLLTSFKKRHGVLVSVEIIDVQVLHEIFNLSPGFGASKAWSIAISKGRITINVAVVCNMWVKQALGNNIEVIEGLGKRWVSVNVPVGASITYHHTTKIDVEEGWVKLCLLVVLVNLPSEERYIDSGVALTWNKKFVGEILWELCVPWLDSL